MEDRNEVLGTVTAESSRGTQTLGAGARVSASDIHALADRSLEARARAAALAAEYSSLLIASEERLSFSKQSRAEMEAARESLHKAVGLYAALLKELNTPPEHTLRLVKETVTEHAARPRPEALLKDVVHWVVETYYGPPPAA